jgi:methenyltetrahydromethanopterin cyclohydrolase
MSTTDVLQTPDNTHPAGALARSTLSVNTAAAPLLQALKQKAAALGVLIGHDSGGVCLIDAGIQAPGSIAAGLLVAEICMGGHGRARLSGRPGEGWPTWLEVSSSQPVLACLASQYAGWSLSASKEETGGKKFFALGSGPARALARKEKLFDELGYHDPAASSNSNSNSSGSGSGSGSGSAGASAGSHDGTSRTSVLVLEVDRPPPAVVINKVLRDCALAAADLSLVLTPTTSTAGTTQVVARVLEVALHKAHELGFDLSHIVDGSASAPLPAAHPDAAVAMGRTNDAILYGGRVHLTVRGSEDDARRLAQQLPSRNSRDFGRPFADIFKEVAYDFYKIDPALFAPAEVWVSHLGSGQTWHAGALDMALLQRQWLLEA